MILNLTTTHSPATDLGYLLHKHPARCQSFKLSFGKAHVFYPEATPSKCTATLLLDVDPIGLVRGRKANTINQYVNDRPYVASSLFSVALAQVYGSALNGRCKDRPTLVKTPIPLQANLAVVPCRGGEQLLRNLFEPLGYMVEAKQHILDSAFPKWGYSHYFTVTLKANTRLVDLLSHLYVLIPVLDDDKHYWVGDDEVKKLLRQGDGWLPYHPEHALIANRYLKRKHSLVRQALEQLLEEEGFEKNEGEQVEEEAQVEKPMRLNEQRLHTVMETLKAHEAQSVLDLGCGEGKLLKMLLQEKSVEKITGLDVSYQVLERARKRLRLDHLPSRQQERLALLHGSLMYCDQRLSGYDAATVIEVIEHLDSPRLAAFERVLFEYAQPDTVIITTPNREYNQLFESLAAGQFRHRDHRFEWTRAEFRTWAQEVAQNHNYVVTFQPIGPIDDTYGSPTQMGVFTKETKSK